MGSITFYKVTARQVTEKLCDSEVIHSLTREFDTQENALSYMSTLVTSFYVHMTVIERKTV
jgi:hypothetical protein